MFKLMGLLQLVAYGGMLPYSQFNKTPTNKMRTRNLTAREKGIKLNQYSIPVANSVEDSNHHNKLINLYKDMLSNNKNIKEICYRGTSHCRICNKKK